ncbi:hypothetical protein RHOER0001_0379 [Rhodococcus erythropolis SK121]|nr:hypothetical protein RHOER0001_0379 [Rhodococcus erythropolis SK121]
MLVDVLCDHVVSALSVRVVLRSDTRHSALRAIRMGALLHQELLRTRD